MYPQRVAAIKQKLEEVFAPTECAVIDESHKHIGHIGAKSGGGHFKVIIRASAFKNTTPLERHRMIYEALTDLMKQDIHALSIDAKDST